MKKIFISFLLLLLGCSSSILLNSNLSEKEILKHVGYVLDDLQEQGFTGVIGKVKNSKIYVPVKINGVSDNFFINTGATYTFLNYDHVSKYHLKKLNTEEKDANIMTLFGNISSYERAEANEFELGNHKFSPWPFIITKGDDNAVLGTDFLHFTNAVIICKYSALLFNVNHKKAENIADSLKKLGYSEIDLTVTKSYDINKITYEYADRTYELKSGTFRVKANFNGIKGIVLIDTGSSYTSIDHNLAKITGRKIRKQNRIYFTDAIGNISYPSVIFSDSLKINNYFLCRNKSFPIFEDLNRNTSSYELPFIGIVGIDFLTQNNAIIDFGNNKLYMIR